MGRKILAVVVALIVAFAVIFIVQMLSSLAVPPPPMDVMNDPARMLDFMTHLPSTVLAGMLIGYILGSFSGGFIVTKMSRRESPGIALPVLIGMVLTAFGILIFFVALPGQPIWYVALSLISFIPFSLLGHRFAR